MKHWFGTAGAAVALGFAQGAAVAAVSPEAAQDLMTKSGSWMQMDSLSAQVRAGMASALQKEADAPPEATKARLLACADTAFGTDAVRATALATVAGALRPEDLPALQAWYDGALGRKIAGMEESATAQVSDPAERLRRGNDALRTASAGRKASLQAIITETRSVDVMADAAIDMAIAVRQGMASVDPSTTASAIADMKADLVARRPQIIERYSQMSLPAYAFAYAGLSDDELRRYADYLAGPAAKAYSDGSVRGVARAMSDGSVKLGRCLKDAGAAKAP